MANTWMIVLTVVGIILLAIGLIGGYFVYAISTPEFFPVWMFLAFIGLILTLIGIAMGVGEKAKGE
ncbi:MAG: hypothetical protein V3U72_03095 [Candidatus Aenigmarchaeota archaeon]